MVEHVMRDPQAVPIVETRSGPPVLPREGPCLVCGEWVEPGEGGAYLVTAARLDGREAELVAHAACLERVAHPSARLPR